MIRVNAATSKTRFTVRPGPSGDTLTVQDTPALLARQQRQARIDTLLDGIGVEPGTLVRATGAIYEATGPHGATLRRVNERGERLAKLTKAEKKRLKRARQAMRKLTR
jgi:hypothetical protein